MEKNVLISYVVNSEERDTIFYAAAEYNGGIHYSPVYYYGVGGIKAILAQNRIDYISIILKGNNSCEQAIREDLQAFIYDREDIRFNNHWKEALSEETRNKLDRAAEILLNEYDLADMKVQHEVIKETYRIINNNEYLTNQINAALKTSGAYSGEELSYISYKLYSRLPARYKIHCREDNINTEIGFVVDSNNDYSFEKATMEFLADAIKPEKEGDRTNFWLFDSAVDPAFSYAHMSLLKMLTEQIKGLNCMGISSICSDNGRVIISDKTDFYRVSRLYDALWIFTQYGKVDLLVRTISEEQRVDSTIASMIYAMKMVDDGVSLCDIDSIMGGIGKLKDIINSQHEFENPFIELVYNIIVASVGNSYGKLMEGDEIDCLELAKWANDRGMYQQALTVIEAKIPEDMVKRGIYYFYDETSDVEEVMEKFAIEFSRLKPFERYKMRILEHYFIKTYPRDLAKASRDVTEKQKQYINAKFSVGLINTTDDSYIKAYTKCTNLDDLTEAYFAYNHAGIIRNLTNHAAEGDGDIDISLDETKQTEKKTLVTEAINYFIKRYEIVREQVKDVEYVERKLNVGAVKRRGKDIREERFNDRNPDNSTDKSAGKPIDKPAGKPAGKPADKQAGK